MTCGCEIPDAKHDRAAIYWDDLTAAAADAGISPQEAARNITAATEQMSKRFHVVKAQDEKRFLLMVGYSPNRMPKRGADGFVDIASPEVVEKACWRFMVNGAGAGLMHKAGGEKAFKVVENSIYRNDEPWVVTAVDGTQQTIRKGDWLIGVICSPQVYDDFKAGKYGSGSLQGGASRMAARPETLARQRS